MQSQPRFVIHSSDIQSCDPFLMHKHCDNKIALENDTISGFGIYSKRVRNTGRLVRHSPQTPQVLGVSLRLIQ